MLASYRIYLEEGGPAAFVDIEQNGSDFIVSGRGIARHLVAASVSSNR